MIVCERDGHGWGVERFDDGGDDVVDGDDVCLAGQLAISGRGDSEDHCEEKRNGSESDSRGMH